MKTKPAQQEFPFKRPHGGKRAGAGRPNLSGKQAHLRRPHLNARHPVHVTLKLAPGLPHLRRKETFKCLREAVKTARKRGFSVSHFAILSNHLHLILEPQGPKLGRIFQSLCISFAKRLNRKLGGRKGAVFHDRYHQHVLKTPTEVRRALAYVLTNESRHEMRRHGKKPKHLVRIDPYSSALAFRKWKSLLGARIEFDVTAWSEAAIHAWYDEILTPARSWLLTQGWTKA